MLRDEHVYNHHMDELLMKKFGDDISIVVLDQLTDGSVCSCLFAEHLLTMMLLSNPYIGYRISSSV